MPITAAIKHFRQERGTVTTVPTSSIDANNAYLSTPYTIYNETGGVILTVNRFRRNGRNSFVGMLMHIPMYRNVLSAGKHN